MEARLAIVGLVENGSFNLPFTQQDIANATGMSTVHVNRTAQELRRRALLTWEARKVTVLNRNALWELGEFAPDYLHQG
jgi:CRP-like cAMP-binding protein